MNCDASFVGGKVALAFVVHDDAGLLVVAITKQVRLSSAYEAKMKSIEWAMSFASSKPWNNLSFSLDSLAVVKEIKSSQDPSGWFTKDFILCIRSLLSSKCWNFLGMSDILISLHIILQRRH